MTCTPGFTRSSQSFRFLGLPLRTRKTYVDVYGVELFGNNVRQLAGIFFVWVATALMSPSSASVSTSARKPSITARACDPEPECDCRMEMALPAFSFQCL